jgi:hypothetical protein
MNGKYLTVACHAEHQANAQRYSRLENLADSCSDRIPLSEEVDSTTVFPKIPSGKGPRGFTIPSGRDEGLNSGLGGGSRWRWNIVIEERFHKTLTQSLEQAGRRGDDVRVGLHPVVPGKVVTGFLDRTAFEARPTCRAG